MPGRAKTCATAGGCACPACRARRLRLRGRVLLDRPDRLHTHLLGRPGRQPADLRRLRLRRVGSALARCHRDRRSMAFEPGGVFREAWRPSPSPWRPSRLRRGRVRLQSVERDRRQRFVGAKPTTDPSGSRQQLPAPRVDRRRPAASRPHSRRPSRRCLRRRRLQPSSPRRRAPPRRPPPNSDVRDAAAPDHAQSLDRPAAARAGSARSVRSPCRRGGGLAARLLARDRRPSRSPRSRARPRCT